MHKIISALLTAVMISLPKIYVRQPDSFLEIDQRNEKSFTLERLNETDGLQLDSYIKNNQRNEKSFTLEQLNETDDLQLDSFIKNNQRNENAFILACSNQTNDLFVDTTSLAIKVTDRASGKTVLDSCPITYDEVLDNGLNLLWENFASSAVSVYYTNEKIFKPLTLFNDTVIGVELNENGFTAKIEIGEIGISFDLNVTLQENEVNVTIPFSSITESKTPLMRIAVYPFLNASRGITDGFILLPDGCGAIIDTSQKTDATEPYVARIYGLDVGINPDAYAHYGDVKPYEATFSAFGVKNENSHFATINSGAEYCELTASKSGITTDYNFAYPTFIYRESYFLPTDNKGGVVQTVQKNKNEFTAEISYKILSRGTVGEMAKAYSEKLNLPNEKVEQAVKLKADFVIGDIADGFLFFKRKVATNFDFIQKAKRLLHQNGVAGIDTTLISFYKNGISGAPRHYPVSKKAGGEKAVKKLGDVKLRLDYTRAYNTAYTKAKKGYSNKDLAISIGRKRLNEREYNFPQKDRLDEWLLLDLDSSSNKCKKEIKNLKKLNLGFSLDGVSRLYSSYNQKSVSVSESKRAIREIANLTSATEFIRPCDFLYNRVSSYVGMPVYTSQFNICRKGVPFLSMALRSNMQLFGEYINVKSFGEDTILKHIEYALNPSYLFTMNSSSVLEKTPFKWLYSSKFSDLMPSAINVYNKIDVVLSKVAGATFIDYNFYNNVSECVYSNGVTIYINYGDSDENFNGVTIKPHDYAIITKTEQKV